MSIMTAPDITAFVDEGLGHSSYLVDLGDDTALVIDPARMPFAQQAEADRRGLRIAFTADTHAHADYISGSPDLAADGARFLAPSEAHLQMPHHGLVDGDEIAVGTYRLRAIGTPGHTPDHLAYLLSDTDGSPLALFSGGSLMVGTVGRTDLLGTDLAEDLARRLYHALHEEILTLPDDLAVFPTHGAGSFCSASAGAQHTTTIGRERATNPLLAAATEDEFVHRLLDRLGTFPTYFSILPALNQRGRPHLETLPTLAALEATDIERRMRTGAALVDARPAADYAAGHIPGSLSIELRPVFASWLGWLVDPDTELVFVTAAGQDHDDVVRQCLTIGFERLAGHLAGGIDAWRSSGRETTATPIVDSNDWHGSVLDVRQDDEYASGHVPGSLHVELGALPSAETPDTPVATMCGKRERAMTAASVLERRGLVDIVVLDGGFAAWRAGGRPIKIGA